MKKTYNNNDNNNRGMITLTIPISTKHLFRPSFITHVHPTYHMIHFINK